MRKITWYICKHVIISTLMILFIVCAIQGFMELLGQFNQVGKAHYTLSKAFMYVILQLPMDLYHMFPMIGFLGSLIGLGRLSSNSELIVMRASGISKGQIVRSVIIAAVMMIFVVTLVGEVLGPICQSWASNIRNQALGYNHYSASGSWIRHGNKVYFIGDILSDKKVVKVSGFNFTDNHGLKSVFYAKYGELNNKKWVLHDVTTTQITGNRLIIKKSKSMPLGVDFMPKYQVSSQTLSLRESVVQLLHNIMYLHQVGLSSTEYQFEFWQRILSPITIIIMICLGVPFVFGSLRDSTMGLRMMVGVILGFGFYILNQFFGPVTMVLQFPPFWAAVLPTLLFLLVYFILMRRIN